MPDSARLPEEEYTRAIVDQLQALALALQRYGSYPIHVRTSRKGWHLRQQVLEALEPTPADTPQKVPPSSFYAALYAALGSLVPLATGHATPLFMSDSVADRLFALRVTCKTIRCISEGVEGPMRPRLRPTMLALFVWLCFACDDSPIICSAVATTTVCVNFLDVFLCTSETPNPSGHWLDTSLLSLVLSYGMGRVTSKGGPSGLESGHLSAPRAPMRPSRPEESDGSSAPWMAGRNSYEFDTFFQFCHSNTGPRGWLRRGLEINERVRGLVSSEFVAIPRPNNSPLLGIPPWEVLLSISRTMDEFSTTTWMIQWPPLEKAWVMRLRYHHNSKVRLLAMQLFLRVADTPALSADFVNLLVPALNDAAHDPCHAVVVAGFKVQERLLQKGLLKVNVVPKLANRIPLARAPTLEASFMARLLLNVKLDTADSLKESVRGLLSFKLTYERAIMSLFLFVSHPTLAGPAFTGVVSPCLLNVTNYALGQILWWWTRHGNISVHNDYSTILQVLGPACKADLPAIRAALSAMFS